MVRTTSVLAQARLSPRPLLFALVGSLLVAACGSESKGGASEGDAGPNGSLPGASSFSGNYPQCPALPPGVQPGVFVGDQFPDLNVRDCDGNPVSLNVTCGSKALWFFLVHEWCPHCKKVGTFSENLQASLESQGLRSIHVILQNDKREAPTAADCRDWRDRNKLSKVQVFYDPAGVTKALNDSSYTSLSVFIDKDRVIQGKSHTDDETVLRRELEPLLSR